MLVTILGARQAKFGGKIGTISERGGLCSE